MPQRMKSPSLAQDLMMLGDVYLTLAWVARVAGGLPGAGLRHGSVWPWEDGFAPASAALIEMPRPENDEVEEAEPEPVGQREG